MNKEAQAQLAVIILFFIIMIIILGSCKLINTFSGNNVPKYITPSSSQNTSPINPIKILDEKVFFPFIISDNILYLSNGNIYSYNLAGQQKNKLTEANLQGVPNIFYQPAGNQAIVQSNNGNYSIKLYSLTDKNTSDLSTKISSLIWLQNSNKIVYIYNDNDAKKSQLNIANPDGTNWQTIYDLVYNENGYRLFRKNDNEIIYYINTSDVRGVDIYVINLETKKIQNITRNDIYVSPLISPDTNALLYQNYNSITNLYSSSILNLLSNKKISLSQILNNSTTVWVNNSQKIYSIISEAGQTYLYIYNLSSNTESTYYFSSEIQLGEIGDLLISQDGNNLYFTSDNYLYKIDISTLK